MYLENKEVFNKDFFKIVDLVFMFFYAIGFLMLGNLGDKYNLRYYLAFAGFIVFASVAGQATMGLLDYVIEVLFVTL